MGRLDGIRRWWKRKVECFHHNHDVQYSGPWVPGRLNRALRIDAIPERFEVMTGVCKNCGCKGEMIHYPASGKTQYVTYDDGPQGSRYLKSEC